MPPLAVAIFSCSMRCLVAGVSLKHARQRGCHSGNRIWLAARMDRSAFSAVTTIGSLAAYFERTAAVSTVVRFNDRSGCPEGAGVPDSSAEIQAVEVYCSRSVSTAIASGTPMNAPGFPQQRGEEDREDDEKREIESALLTGAARGSCRSGIG